MVTMPRRHRRRRNRRRHFLFFFNAPLDFLCFPSAAEQREIEKDRRGAPETIDAQVYCSLSLSPPPPFFSSKKKSEAKPASINFEVSIHSLSQICHAIEKERKKKKFHPKKKQTKNKQKTEARLLFLVQIGTSKRWLPLRAESLSSVRGRRHWRGRIKTTGKARKRRGKIIMCLFEKNDKRFDRNCASLFFFFFPSLLHFPLSRPFFFVVLNLNASTLSNVHRRQLESGTSSPEKRLKEGDDRRRTKKKRKKAELACFDDDEEERRKKKRRARARWAPFF